jgi:hypothetical protein
MSLPLNPPPSRPETGADLSVDTFVRAITSFAEHSADRAVQSGKRWSGAWHRPCE